MGVDKLHGVVFTTNKTDRHDIAEILLNVPVNTIILTLTPMLVIFNE